MAAGHAVRRQVPTQGPHVGEGRHTVGRVREHAASVALLLLLLLLLLLRRRGHHLALLRCEHVRRHAAVRGPVVGLLLLLLLLLLVRRRLTLPWGRAAVGQASLQLVRVAGRQHALIGVRHTAIRLPCCRPRALLLLPIAVAARAAHGHASVGVRAWGRHTRLARRHVRRRLVPGVLHPSPAGCIGRRRHTALRAAHRRRRCRIATRTGLRHRPGSSHALLLLLLLRRLWRLRESILDNSLHICLAPVAHLQAAAAGQAFGDAAVRMRGA